MEESYIIWMMENVRCTYNINPFAAEYYQILVSAALEDFLIRVG